MASVINQIKLGDVEYAIAASAYAECKTAAPTATKVATICTDNDSANAAFTLIKGVSVQVKFTESNSAANPTLNVNGTGDNFIYYNGKAVTADYLKANHVYTFVYNGVQWEIVGGDTELKYSNSKGAARYAVGGLPQGFDFTNEMSVKQILDKIFFPFTSITVVDSSAAMRDSSNYTMSKDSASVIPTYRTLAKVTLSVTQNDTTGLNMYLEDITAENTPEILVARENLKVSNNIVTFEIPTDKQRQIKTPRNYRIRYSYLEEDGSRCADKTIDLGTFGLTFTPPSSPGVTLKDSNGNTLSNIGDYKVGQSCTVAKVAARVANLNSAVGDDGKQGINKFVLTKSANASFSQTVDTTDKKSCEFSLSTADKLGPTYNDTTSGYTTYTYSVVGKYNKRTVNNATWTTNGGETDAGSATVKFKFEPATCSFSGITAQTKSKLDPITINANSLKATLTKKSDRIVQVDLYINGSKVADQTLNFLNLLTEDTDLTKTAYDTTSRSKAFSYSNTTCTTTTFQAKATCASGDISSDPVTVTFKAPYCWGFIDNGASVDRTTLESFVAKGMELNTPQYSLSKQTSIKIDNQGYKKFVYALPKSGGVFSAITDNNSKMPCTTLFDKTEQTITFADGSTETYQIWILKSEGSEADVNLTFS